MQVRKIGRRMRKNYAPEEISAIRAGVPFASVDQARRVRRKLAGDENFKRWLDNRIQFGQIADIKGDWEMYRRYSAYNKLFSPYLGKSIVDELGEMAWRKSSKKRKKVPLEILDDGAGHGVFLEHIKHLMGEHKVPVRTTAVVLYASEDLKARKEEGSVDEIIENPVETFVPRRRYDAIFSMLGGIEYSLMHFTRETVLKYAHALNAGGIAVIGLDIKTSYRQQMEEFKRRVIKSFEKRGFKADFYHNPENKAEHLPQDVLIIRRIR